MALLNRMAILAAQDMQTVDVNVPEWGGSVRVRVMTVSERNEFVRRSNSEDKESVGAWLVSLLTIDGDGKRVFEESDVGALQAKSFRAVDAVIAAILSANGMTPEKVDEAGKV